MVHALLSDIERVSGSALPAADARSRAVPSPLIYIAVAARLSPGLTLVVCAGGLATLAARARQQPPSADRSEAVSEAQPARVRDGDRVAGRTEGGQERRRRDARHRGVSAASRARARRGTSSCCARSPTRSGGWISPARSASSCCCSSPCSGSTSAAPGLLLIVFVFARVMPRMLVAARLGAAVSRGTPCVRQRHAHSSPRARRTRSGCVREGDARLDLTRSLTFDAVTFAYGSAAGPVLDRLTLTIEAGRTTALVGASGAGKSTVADLAMGLLSPASGRVLVDDSPLTADRLRRHGATASATCRRMVSCFTTPSARNMLWACPTATDAEIWNSLETAAAGRLRRRSSPTASTPSSAIAASALGRRAPAPRACTRAAASNPRC